MHIDIFLIPVFNYINAILKRPDWSVFIFNSITSVTLLVFWNKISKRRAIRGIIEQ